MIQIAHFHQVRTCAIEVIHTALIQTVQAVQIKLRYDQRLGQAFQLIPIEFGIVGVEQMRFDPAGTGFEQFRCVIKSGHVQCAGGMPQDLCGLNCAGIVVLSAMLLIELMLGLVQIVQRFVHQLTHHAPMLGFRQRAVAALQQHVGRRLAHVQHAFFQLRLNQQQFMRDVLQCRVVRIGAGSAQMLGL